MHHGNHLCNNVIHDLSTVASCQTPLSFGVDTSVSEWNSGRPEGRNGKEHGNYCRVEGVGTEN